MKRNENVYKNLLFTVVYLIEVNTIKTTKGFDSTVFKYPEELKQGKVTCCIFKERYTSL